MKRLRIVISNYDDLHNPYYAGGGAKATHEIAKFLSKRHEVTVVTGKYRGAKSGYSHGVRYVHVGMPFGGPIMSQISFAMCLPYMATRLSFDIWFENFMPPHSTNMIPLFTNNPVIGITTVLDAESFAKKYHLPFHHMERWGLKYYRYIIAFSSAIQEKVKSLNPRAHIRIIPEGVPLRYFRISPSEHPYVCFLGRIDIFQKGLDLLLSSWKAVATKYPDIRLIIIGEGTAIDHQKIKQMINDFGLQKSVELVGRKGEEEKLALLRNAMVVVFPSRFETFGIAALESLALGKPVICSDIKGFSWIDRSICKKIPVENTDHLARAMITLLRDPSLRKTYSERGRQFAKSFTWDRVAKEYERFALDVCNKKV